MGRLRGLFWATALVLGGIVTGLVASQATDASAASGPRASAAARLSPDAQQARMLAVLSRLHHAAQREVQLGDLAEAGGAHPETRRYGAQLAADFRTFQQRVLVAAAQYGITPEQLDETLRGENVPALERESDDLSRLANERGDRFDRDYWVAVSEEQSAAGDMLVSLASLPGAPTELMADMSRLYERSSRRAVVAAEATIHTGPMLTPGAAPASGPESAPVSTPPGGHGANPLSAPTPPLSPGR